MRSGFLPKLVVTLSVTLLVGISLLLVVDGLEWATLSLLGIDGMPAFVLLGLTGLPLLWLIGRFARTVWRVEGELHDVG